jgi:CIC family chloride channel protein
LRSIYFPLLTGGIGSYALVGMGVLFAGFIRAPLTSVFMVLEMSGNYSIILPVILANTIAYLLSRILTPVPIFEIFTHQDGLDLPSMEEQREENPRHIEDALHPVDVPVLEGNQTLQDARRRIETATPDERTDCLLVRLKDGSWYVMTAQELSDTFVARRPDLSLRDAIPPERAPMLFPDLPLDSALPHFARWPLLPVRNRAVKGLLEGVVTSEDVLNTYRRK